MLNPQEKLVHMESLPTSALSNILRFFGECPRHPYWRSKFRTRALLSIIRTISPLKNLAQEQITSLDLASADVPCEEDWDKSLREIFATFGKSCSSLRLHVYLDVRSELCKSSWLPEFTRNCGNLKRLDLRTNVNFFPLCKVLAGSHGKLEHLALDVGQHQGTYFSAVAKHCSGLKSLDISVYLKNHEALGGALQTVGPSLLSLSMDIANLAAPDTENLNAALRVEDIGRLCPNLRDLQIYGDTEQYRRAVEELCTGYGAQLERFSFPFCGKNVQFLHDLVRECPNVLVETGTTSRPRTIDDFLNGPRNDPSTTMDILGPRLSVFSFRCGFAMSEHFVSAASKCKNLTSVAITECTSQIFEIMSGLFEQPKVHLLQLRVTFHLPDPTFCGPSFPDLLALIAKNSGSLKTLLISCPYQHYKALALVADANKQLETAHVCLYREEGYTGSGEHDRGDAIAWIIGSFSGCPTVHTIAVYDDFPSDGIRLAAVEKACFMIRSQWVTVSVNGISYLR